MTPQFESRWVPATVWKGGGTERFTETIKGWTRIAYHQDLIHGPSTLRAVIGSTEYKPCFRVAAAFALFEILKLLSTITPPSRPNSNRSAVSPYKICPRQSTLYCQHMHGSSLKLPHSYALPAHVTFICWFSRYFRSVQSTLITSVSGHAQVALRSRVGKRL